LETVLSNALRSVITSLTAAVVAAVGSRDIIGSWRHRVTSWIDCGVALVEAETNTTQSPSMTVKQRTVPPTVIQVHARHLSSV